MNALLLALAPSVAIIWYIYARDRYDKEPFGLLLLCFMQGVLSIIPALFGTWFGDLLGFGVSDSFYGTLFYTIAVIGLVEESAKFLFLRTYIYSKAAFNEPFDGIIYAVMIGMGFATFENLAYVWTGGWQVAVLRMFTAVPAHAVFGVIMGYYIGMAKFTPDARVRQTYMIKSLLIPVIIHGLYDFFLFQRNFEYLAIASLVLLVLGIRYAIKAIGTLQKSSPFAPHNQDTIE